MPMPTKQLVAREPGEVLGGRNVCIEHHNQADGMPEAMPRTYRQIEIQNPTAKAREPSAGSRSCLTVQLRSRKLFVRRNCGRSHPAAQHLDDKSVSLED